MKYKLISILLFFSYSYLICQNNNDEKTITAQQLMISIKKFDTNALIEISRDKKITEEDRQQVLQNVKTEIQKYSGGGLDFYNTINVIRVFVGFFCFYLGAEIALDPSAPIKQLRAENPNLAKVSGVISALGLWQFLVGCINLQPENNRLNVLTIMEFYVKLIPAKN